MASALENYISTSDFIKQFQAHNDVYADGLQFPTWGGGVNVDINEQTGVGLLKKTVSIVTADGRIIVGTLKGFDQTINLILDESHERVFSSTSGVEQVVLGLYIIRGDNVAVIGEIDDDVDSSLDLNTIRAEPLNPVVH